MLSGMDCADRAEQKSRRVYPRSFGYRLHQHPHGGRRRPSFEQNTSRVDWDRLQIVHCKESADFYVEVVSPQCRKCREPVKTLLPILAQLVRLC
jgi:hypothetical protein